MLRRNQLNAHQLEILKLFTRSLDEKDLIEIKRLIVNYLSQKNTDLADEVWEEKNWSDEDIEKMLHEHQRTSYNPEN